MWVLTIVREFFINNVACLVGIVQIHMDLNIQFDLNLWDFNNFDIYIYIYTEIGKLYKQKVRSTGKKKGFPKLYVSKLRSLKKNIWIFWLVSYTCTSAFGCSFLLKTYFSYLLEVG